jgi:uncharacterized protein (TIGR02271 family)
MVQHLREMRRIQKERVPAGEAGLRKDVVTETQNVEVPTSREEPIVERHAGGEPTPSGRSPEHR